MDNETGKARKDIRSGQAAGVAGILFAGLLVASLVLFNGLTEPAQGQELTEWFAGETAGTISIIVLYLIPFAGIAFLWFMAVLREHASHRADRFFDTVFLGSGLLFVAMLFGGASALASIVPRSSASVAAATGSEAIEIAQSIAFSFFNIYGARAAGVFVMVTSSIILRTGFLPRWIALLGLAIALVLLLGLGFFQWIIYLFPAWVTLMSIALLVRLSRDPQVES